jgi:hypothetical protein
MTFTFTFIKAAFAGIILTVGSYANAGLIAFSFTDDPTVSLSGRNHVAGTVTGQLTFSEDTGIDGTYMPDFVAFTSDLAWLGASEKMVDILETTAITDQSLGFTFVNGIVVEAQLFMNFQDPTVGGLQLRVNHDTPGANLLMWNGGTGPQNVIGNKGGFNGISFSSVAVTEPSALALFALGMVGLASRRFKKHS